MKWAENDKLYNDEVFLKLMRMLQNCTNKIYTVNLDKCVINNFINFYTIGT